MSAPSAVPSKPPPAPGLLGDYPPAAKAYWWLLVLAGGAALALAASGVAAMPGERQAQVLLGVVVATLVGLFPLRVPGTKTSFAAGDVFIFLLLLTHGPQAAALAAGCEAALCAWRSSARWSSRLASPMAAALAMLLCGSAFEHAVALLASLGHAGQGVRFAAVLGFAALYFLVSPTLVTAVLYLKRRRAPTPAEWLSTFGMVGLGYAASASIAGVLHVAAHGFGPTAVIVATPMIGMFVAGLRAYFSQQEARETAAEVRATRERADNAEREAALVAQHLRELAASERRFLSAFNHAAIGMALVDVRGRVIQANAPMARLLGVDSAAALVGRSVREAVAPEQMARFEQLLRDRPAEHAESAHAELRLLRLGETPGPELWASVHVSEFDNQGDAGSVWIVQAFDVTARRLAEGRLQHLAFHDSLTDLANRSRLLEGVALAIAQQARDPEHRFSLTHVSFDRYRLLADSHGHGVGDRFLVAIANRIRALVRPGDVLARIGGDDFGILALHRGAGTHHAVALAERLQAAFEAPVIVDEVEVHTGASVGITFSEIGYDGADEVLRDAGLAMAKARASGRARYALFDPGLHAQAAEQLALETELRRAIDQDQLHLAYQPIFAVDGKKLSGFEALCRWQHPERGAVAPAVFIPVAESSGLVVRITRWAIASACAQLRAWREGKGGAATLFVNVNITGHDLCEPGFAEYVREVLLRNELPARCLALEITETSLMQQLELGAATLRALREMGIGLSVDDFGTGYSSLSHLSTLPITSLKIDRSFVDRLDGRSGESEIVRTVVQLGAALGKRVVAEGVETPEQLRRLGELGCGHVQGYLLSRPLQPAQVAALLAAPLELSAEAAPLATRSAPMAG